MPNVSVIIPTYNRSGLVKEAVESVLQQSYTDFEILVVDDGSTDDTVSVIQKIPDKGVRYFHKINGGVASARNYGIKRAEGKYIALLDDDDLWPTEYLQIMIRKLEENPQYGLAYSPFNEMQPDGRETLGSNTDKYISGWLTENFYDKVPSFTPSAIIVKRSYFNTILFDEYLTHGEDTDLLLRLSAKTQFLCVPDVCVTRRKGPGSMGELYYRSISYNALLILERFYFQLGGDEVIQDKKAKRRISRHYRHLGRKHYLEGHRYAAIYLLKKAISYYPFELKYYLALFKAILLSKEKDGIPNWQMPKPLPTYITAFGEKIEPV